MLRRMSETALFKEAVGILVDVVLMASLLLLLRTMYRDRLSAAQRQYAAVV